MWVDDDTFTFANYFCCDRITLTESGSSHDPSCGWAILMTVRRCRRRSTLSSVQSPSSTYCAPSSALSSAASVEVFDPVAVVHVTVAALPQQQQQQQSQLPRYVFLTSRLRFYFPSHTQCRGNNNNKNNNNYNNNNKLYYSCRQTATTR